MRSSICWTIITLLTCFNYSESKSAQFNSSSNVCTQKEQAELDGKCTSYVNSLLNLTDEYSTILVSLSTAKNISTLCDKITTCFGELNCAEAQRNKETYERKCEKMEFANYEMMDCVSEMYTVFYRGEHRCIGYSNFLTKDSKARRNAFVDEKSCVKLIAAKGCRKRALEYLDSKYERFVDIMSNKPDNNNCNSLYDELISKQCEPVKKKLSAETKMLKRKINSSRNISTSEKMMQQWKSKLIRSQPNNTAKTPECEELKNCMQNSCYFSETQINETVEVCTGMYEDAFKFCLDEVQTREDLRSSYTCVGDNNTSDYKDDKECMKTIMSDNCGHEILTDFDRKWDNYRKKTNSTSGISN